MRTVTALAVVAATLAIGASAFAAVFVVTSPLLGRAYGFTPELQAFVFAFEALVVPLVTAYGLVGLLLVRQPGAARIGLLLTGGALGFSLVPFGYLVGGSLAMAFHEDPIAQALFLLGPVLNAPGFALILPVLAIAFPDGRLPSSRWRFPVAIALGLLGASALLFLVRPGEIAGAAGTRNPFGIGGLPAAVTDLAGVAEGLGVVVTAILGILAVISRYRAGGAMVRRQLRWFVAAVFLGGVPLAISVIPGIGNERIGMVAVVGLALVPVSVGIAVTRYRLYEIDRLISRGLSWGLLTAALVGVYAGIVLVLQGALAGVTQGQTLAVAASTLAAAALFQPLRSRIQRAVDRRFDRARYDAERTAEAFAVRLRDQVDLDGVRGDIVATVEVALRPGTTGLWVRGGTGPWEAGM